MRKDIYYKSQDNFTNIHACIWEPSCKIKAILQVSHGMIEHIKRYENFAEELNKNGILVCGNDHLGHGLSVIDNEHYGYFAANNADDILIEDVYSLTKLIKEDYKDTPYFVLGHSMGSFIIRNYIAKHGNDIDGVIISGTGYQSSFKMLFAKIITSIIQFYKRGWFYRSRFLANRTIGNYHKFFNNNENRYCWLTKDKNIIKSYESDPLCNFKFTCNGYFTMFSLIQNANKIAKKIHKNLPILFISGKDDPVGNFGKGIIKLTKKYENLGLNDIKVKIYNNMRHEVINETERAIVLNDIIQFINLKT